MPESSASTRSQPSPIEDWGVVTGGYAVMAVSALVLIGWCLRIEIFVTVLPGLPPMMFNAALCLALLGLVAVLAGLGKSSHRLVVVAPLLVIGIGTWALLENALGRDPGTGTPLDDGRFLATASVDGWMGTNTALAFILVAITTVFGARDGRVPWKLASAPAMLGGLIALIALAGYIGRHEPAFRWDGSPGMAAHTAGCLLLLSTIFILDLRRRVKGVTRISSWSLALAAAALLLVAVGWVAYRSLDQLVRTADGIARAHEVDNRIHRLRLALAEFEAARHGLNLADDPAGPRNATEAKERIDALLAELRTLIVDTDQRSRAARLETLVEETLPDPASSPASTTATAPAPIDPPRLDSDRELRAELHAVIRRMLRAETDLLAERQALGARAVAEARGVILLGVSFVLLLGVGAVFLLRRILREVGESRERFASIFTSVAEGLVLQNRDGVILESNIAAERVLGLTAAQLSGRDSMDPRWRTVHEDGSPYPGDTHPAIIALRTGEAQRDQIMGVQRSDGSLAWISINSEPIRNPDGEVRAVVTSFFEITARRAAERALRESEERFRNTFEHAGIGMAVVGLDGRWMRVNHALLHLVGYEESELLAKTFQDITHPDDLDADLVHLRRLVAGEIASYQMEKRYFHRAGHTLWARLTVSIVRDASGGPCHFVSQIEDITEQKHATDKLAAYAARLAEKNRELQDFAYVASHDLQEPLRKIQAFGDRLDQCAGPRLEPEERDYLARMRAAAARMSGLIEALLAYSRISSQGGSFGPVALDLVLQEALQDLELRVEKTAGRVEAGPLPELHGDAIQLRQLFQNLVGNALKYHRPDAPPRVRVSAAPASPGALPGPGLAWEITVEDNGIGFEPRHAETIFGVFQRLHGLGQYEGTGVGLAICRRIVERHGGLIRAEGRPGEGARFVVTLPATPAPNTLDA